MEKTKSSDKHAAYEADGADPQPTGCVAHHAAPAPACAGYFVPRH